MTFRLLITLKTSHELERKTSAEFHQVLASVTRVLQLLPLIFAMQAELGNQKERAPTTMAYLISENRLFCLKLSEWSTLLVGVALCGILTLLF